MSRIRVTGIAGIADLADDCRAIPAIMRQRARRAVKASIDEGAEDAKRIARKMSGPHGANYANRIESEMTGPLGGEWGPSPLIGTDYVGVSGTVGAMRDLNKSADRQGPRFQKRVGLIADGLFWPGG